MTYDEFEQDVVAFSRAIDENRRIVTTRPAPQIQVEIIELKGEEAKAFDRGETTLESLTKTANSNAQGV